MADPVNNEMAYYQTARADGRFHAVTGVPAPIGRRLLYSLLLISTVMTLLTSAIVLWTDYRAGIRHYDNALEQIRNSYQSSISYSLWSFDRRQLETQLQGIMNFPGIVHVQLNQDGNVTYSMGDLYQGADQRRAILLQHNNAGVVHDLGILRISQSYAELYQALKGRAAEILLTQLLLVLSIAVAVLLTVHRLITRRLNRMASWASQFSLENPDLELQIDAPGDKRDELSYLADAINTMRLTIQTDLSLREREQQQLLSLQHQLALAVDNAELGFCRYQIHDKRFHANNHFAAQLGMSDVALEALQDPMAFFIDRITGPEADAQIERIRQLLQGHQVRIHDSFRVMNQQQQECFFDISLQVIEYDNNRPEQILICMTDRSSELKAREKAQRLQLQMSDEIHKHTELLEQDNLHLQQQIEHLSRQLKQLKSSRQPEFLHRICKLIGYDLQQWQQAHSLPNAALWERFFRLDIDGLRESIDQSLYLQHWLEQFGHQHGIKTDLHLPLSLFSEDYPPAFDFLLGCLLTPEDNRLRAEDELYLRIHVQDEGVNYEWRLSGQGWPHHPHNQAYRLAEALVALRYRGTLQWRMQPSTSDQPVQQLLLFIPSRS